MASFTGRAILIGLEVWRMSKSLCWTPGLLYWNLKFPGNSAEVVLELPEVTGGEGGDAKVTTSAENDDCSPASSSGTAGTGA